MDHHPETDPDRPADPLAELFPGPAHLGRPRRRTARRVVAGGAAVALLALGGAAVAGAGADDEGGYRTATAATREVSQVLDRVGTIEPVSQASVAFPVGGTVSRVGVKVGDTVIVGQELADLDVTELTRTLHDREATLAQAELVLQKALDGEDVSGLTGGGGSGASGGAAPSGSSSDSAASAKGISWDTSGSSAKAQLQPVALPVASSTTVPTAASSATDDAELRAAQQAVLDAQQTVDRDLAAAQVALDTATEVCAAVGAPTDDAPSTSSTTSTTTPTTSTTPSASSPGGSGMEACRAALAAVLDAQSLVAADQAALAEASRALDDLLADRAASSGGSSSGGTGGGTGTGSLPSGSTSGSSSGTPSSGSTPSAGTGSTTSTTSTASSEDLVAYQKAVDAAAAQVAAAEQALDQARIVSPIAGTVVSVGLAVGDEVTAGSATAAVVVAGAGGYEVTTHVSVDDVPDLEVGQTATVLPDGSTTEVRGEVVRIGAADTSSGSASYPVTIGLAGDTGDLGNGSVASVEIVTDDATRALAVPVSAVTVDGDRHTVTVLDGTTTRTVEVEVGAVGQEWIEITSGVADGDEVVLADLSEALPSSATEAREQQQGGTTRSFGPGGGSFTPPAGFTGGRPPGN